MKKTTLRRLFAAIVSIVMMLSMCIVNVGAEPTPTFPNDGGDGSITINKVATDGTTPVDGVDFSIVKVADAVQYSVSSNDGNTTTTTTSLGFTLTSVGETLFTDITSTGQLTEDDEAIYTATALQEALNKLARNTDGSLTNPPAWTSTQTTADGKATFGSLGFGIYLIDETDISGANIAGEEVDVFRATGPYLVSVPTTDGGTEWKKDVTVNAKNIVNTEQVAKTASYEDGTTGTGDFSIGIGENFKYTITSDILVTNDDSEYTKYIVSDTAGKGITVDLSNIAVKYDGESFETATAMAAGDYAVSAITTDDETDTQTFTVTLTDDGLAKINAVTADAKLYIQYTAQLNDEATSGNFENATRNDVGLTYAHNGGEDQEDPDPTPSDVYTYNIDLSKLFENAAPDGTNINAEAVKFQLYKEDGTTQLFGAIPATASQTGAVEYIIDNDAANAADVGMTNMQSNSATGEFACNSTGKLLIRGLSNGTYQLKEITTVDGYSLLKENVTVTIDDGNATISINNESESIFTLPLTGGSGTWVYTVGGMALMGMAVVLLVTLGKKKTA